MYIPMYLRKFGCALPIHSLLYPGGKKKAKPNSILITILCFASRISSGIVTNLDFF